MIKSYARLMADCKKNDAYHHAVYKEPLCLYRMVIEFIDFNSVVKKITPQTWKETLAFSFMLKHSISKRAALLERYSIGLQDPQ
ncbi:hypothetical protein [Bartonella tribocorum]|nr:hypothetical protein [Bartonella tribocorum]